MGARKSARVSELSYAPGYRERRQEIFHLKRQGRHEDALELAAALRAEGADTPELAVDEADALARLGRPEPALEALERAQERFGQLPPFGRALLGGLLEKGGRLEDAARVFEQLSGEPRLSPAVARRVAEFFKKRGDERRAFWMMQRLQEDTPDSQRQLARSAVDAGLYPEAQEILRRAVTRFPDHQGLFEDYVLERLRGESPEVMAEELETLLSLDSQDASLRLRERLAQALRKQGEYQRARELLEECVRRDPGRAYFVANLGYVCKDMGDLDKALEYLERSLELNPDDQYALAAFLAGCRDSGQAQRARAWIAVRAKERPGLWGAYKRIFRAAKPSAAQERRGR
ncbi:MAG: tetratricopeptide repeat protein [Candidatus Eremiobacterota bacterium]